METYRQVRGVYIYTLETSFQFWSSADLNFSKHELCFSRIFRSYDNIMTAGFQTGPVFCVPLLWFQADAFPIQISLHGHWRPGWG